MSITKSRPNSVGYNSEFYMNKDGIVYVKDKLNDVYRYDALLDTWEKMTVLSNISFPKICIDLKAAKFVKSTFTDVFGEGKSFKGL